MSLARSSSFSSVGSGASSAQSEALSTAGGGQGGDLNSSNDLLEQNQTVQAAIFGVLYTLSKEKYDTSKKFAVAKLVLDFIQCFILIVNPNYGWNIDENLWVWKAVRWVHFSNPIIAKGYSFYITVLYVLAAALLVSILLCIWVGYCFKMDRFPYVWPIKMLRLVVATFFVVFYIGSLAIFMVAISCRWFDPDPLIQLHVKAFPDVKCLSMPHLVHMVVAIGCSIVFCAIAFGMTVADFEMNPVSLRWLASPHARVEVRGFWVKTIMTVTVALLVGLTKIQAIILCATSIFLFWSYVRWEPHFNPWINHTRAALYCMVSWAGIVLVALTFSVDAHRHSYRTTMTTVMLAGLAPALIVGFIASYARLRWRMKSAIKRFVTLPPTVTRLKDIYKFPDAYEVEIVSRMCRQWTDDETLEPDAVKLAEAVFKVGMAQFHDDVFLTITYSNFLIEVQHNYQSGATQLHQAKKLDPGISDRFAIFVREQEHKQKVQTQSSGESATDLVSYVEFQRNYRLLIRAHKQALYATRHFWKQLLRHDVSFIALARTFRNIEVSKSKADRTYKMVLDRYPSSIKLLRSYGRFLEEVKNDPWAAAKYYAEADKAEEQQEHANSDTLIQEGAEGGNVLAQVNEKNNAVVVINAAGIIQMANKVALKMFGYKKGELEGKNVSILMPVPFNIRHNTYLRNYLTTGKAKILDTIREVVGLHKERYVFPLKIAVSKVSGSGADSMFMGVLKPATDDPHTVRAWVLPQGTIICVDAHFRDWFARSTHEVVGKPFAAIAMEQDVLLRLVDTAGNAPEADFLGHKVRADGVHILHKYTDPVMVNVQFDLGGTEGQRLLLANITRRVEEENRMMVCDHRGRIMYMSSELCGWLGHDPKAVVKMDLSHFMNPPYSLMHHKWMKEPNAKVPLQSCRNAATVVMVDAKGASLPVKPHIQTREDGDNVIHVVNVEKSSFEHGVDERCLGMVIDEEGNILEVSATPMALFGIKPAMMVGQNVWQYVDVLHALKDELKEIIRLMLVKAAEKPGYSWRVGIHPPVDESHQQSAIAVAILNKNTKPAIMQIELKEPATEGDLPTIKLYVWKADMITGVVDMDKNTLIGKPACCPLHPTGLLFGCMNNMMSKRQLSSFIKMKSNAEVMLADDKVKGAMKKGTTGRRIGPTRVVQGSHVDGSPLSLKMTMVAKEGSRFAAKLNFNSLVRGDPELFKATLTNTLEQVRANALLNRKPTQEEAALALAPAQALPARDVAKEASKGRRGIKFADIPEEDAPKPAAAAATAGGEVEAGSDSDRDSENDELEAKLEALRAGGRAAMQDADDPHGGGPIDWDAAQADGGYAEVAGSAVSGSEMGDGQSIVAGSEAGGYQSDFKRGKRFKKLTKLLQSPKAKADLNRYRLHTYIVLGVLLAVHTLCFTLFVIFLQDQNDFVRETDSTQDTTVFGINVYIMNRALANLYAGRFNPEWYSWADLDAILADMEMNVRSMELNHQGLFLGFSKLRHLGEAYDLKEIWEGTTLNETLYIDTRYNHTVSEGNSLWLMGNALIASAREIISNHEVVAKATNNSLWLDRNWQYVHLNGAGKNTITTGYRYSLNGMVLRTWNSVQQVNKLGIGLLVVEGVVICSIAILYMWILLQMVARTRYSLFSVFLIIPAGFLRALASKHVTLDGDDGEDSDGEGDQQKAQHPPAQQQQQQQRQQVERAAVVAIPTSGIRVKQVVVDVDDTAGLASHESPWRRAARRLNPVTWIRSRPSHVERSKRRLVRNNSDSIKLIVPFVVWMAAVIFIYAYSYIKLHAVITPLVNLDILNRVKAKTSRVIYAAHELVSAVTPADVAAAQNEVLLREADLHMHYDALLYGGTGLPEMAFSTTAGTLFSDTQPSQLFFRTKGTCYVTERADRWCYTPDQPYYMVSMNALDPMMRRLMEEAVLMGNDAYSDINMTSPRFDFIWKVAYHQLVAGLAVSNEFYSSMTYMSFHTVRVAQIVLFVMSWVAAVFFVFLMFQPFIRQISSEAKQVAELLSQLPPEMDVEGLVSQAMLRNQGKDGEDEAGVSNHRRRASMDGPGGGARRASMDGPPAGGLKDGRRMSSDAPPAKGKMASRDDDASSVASSM